MEHYEPRTPEEKINWLIVRYRGTTSLWQNTLKTLRDQQHKPLENYFTRFTQMEVEYYKDLQGLTEILSGELQLSSVIRTILPGDVTLNQSI